MGGGLMQLVAYGAQDIYLTGNPQITFFKVVYRRHTNFSMESIQQTFDGTTGFGKEVSATISRNGDLVYRMYIEHEARFTATSAQNDKTIGVVSNYGSRLLKEVELEIGGQRIDRHHSHWHETYHQLTEPNATGDHRLTGYTAFDTTLKKTLFNTMSGNGAGVHSGTTATSNITVGGWSATDTGGGGAADTLTGKFWIPLYFWFCRNPGLALPLIALQYHEVKVKVNFESISELGAVDDDDDGFEIDTAATGSVPFGTGNNDNSKFALWCDYIYLDTDERRRFAQVSHEYLIEQVQHTEISDENNFSASLNFNHPVKELVWRGVNQPIKSDKNNDEADIIPGANFIYIGAPITLSGTWQLKLNGHDRFAERDTKYFTRTQIWQHHTGYGGMIVQGSDASGGSSNDIVAVNTQGTDGIAVYSFALKPEEHQPSGTCNFSRIDNAQLVRTNGGNSATDPNRLTGGLHIYAVNYNVLRIMSGMGGLAYSN